MKLKPIILAFLGYYVFACSFQVYASTQAKIAFVINELSFRGIEVSTFDYAHYNETLLGNESIIINFDVLTDNEVRKKFTSRFPGKFFDCSSVEEMDYILSKENVDILYNQKPGHNDGVLSKVCKNAVHAVFPGIEPHGDVYAYISQWFVRQFPQFNLPFVPYMVRVEPTTENLRGQLHIPQDAIVFGRHGGDQSFNVPCAQTAVKEVAQAHPEIYFLFLNTQEFCHLPNVIFLPKTTDMLYKAKFINTCDAMIHARWRGETFGLACAEFSIKNKPVITWTGARERAHIEMLGNKAHYYSNKEELVAILTSFKKEPEKNWDAYSTLYSPEIVMQQFDAVFIQPLITHKRTHHQHQQITFTAPRLADGSINQEFINHMTTVFGCDVVIKEGGNLWQFVDHALTLHKRALLFFDCHWRAQMEQCNKYAPSLIAELTRLKQAMNTQTVLIIDGIHYLDNSSFESAYRLIHEHGYQIYLNYDTLLAFKDANVFVDPIIKAMTLIRLCEIADFAQDKKISQLLAAEQIVGRGLAENLVHAAHNNFMPAPSYAIRYHQLFEGLACLHKKDYRTAVYHFHNILNCGYTHWRIYWYLGQALYKMGDIKSEEAMLHVIQTCPQFAGIIDFKKAINA